MCNINKIPCSNEIMTISNARLDRIFSRSNKLESRVDRLEERLKNLDPVTEGGKIQRIQNRIDRVNNRLDRIEGRLPKDEFEITHRGDGMFDIQVTDSPYDDTYTSGTSLKFSVSGVRPNDKGGTQRQTASIMVHSFDNEEGSTFVGSNSFDKIGDNYPDVAATLYNQNNEVLVSTEVS